MDRGARRNENSVGYVGTADYFELAEDRYQRAEFVREAANVRVDCS